MNSGTNPSAVKSIAEWLGSGSINLFGVPFAGKDTQGARLADLFGGPLLGGGDILRRSAIPKRVQVALDKGQLIPTKDYLEIVLPYLSRPEFAGHPLILSSVGRWHGEEAGVLEATAAADHPIMAVVYLKISEADQLRRWQQAVSRGGRGARTDDNQTILNTRLQEFQNKTLPVIEFYRNQGLLIEVNASVAPDDVTAEILSGLQKMI